MIVSSYVASELLRAILAYKVACSSTHSQSTCLESGHNQLRGPWRFCSSLEYNFSCADGNRGDVSYINLEYTTSFTVLDTWQMR